nr:reverse transcriptase domain-containing protein [Tanacetum cinerariifolium]
MLRTFSFLLSGEAKTWMSELDERTITMWNELKEAFISRYFSLVKFKRLLNKIHSFHQLANESLVDAWFQLKEMLRIYYRYGLTKSTIIQIFYHGLDDPTQEIIDAKGIILYKTPNEAFKILEDKVLLKLDFSGDSQNNPKSKNVVFTGGSNINTDHIILMEKFKDLATKIDSEFLIITKELKERMRPWISRRISRSKLQKCALLSKSLPKPNENDKGNVKFIKENVIQPIPTISPSLNDSTMHILYTNVNSFVDDVLLNHVGDNELNSMDDVGTRKMTKKNDNGMPKELNKEWKMNEKVVPHNKEVYHYLWYSTEIPHLKRIIKES